MTKKKWNQNKMFVMVLLLYFRMSRIVQPKNFFTPLDKKKILKTIEKNWRKQLFTADNWRKSRNWDKDNSYLQFSSIIFSY